MAFNGSPRRAHRAFAAANLGPAMPRKRRPLTFKQTDVLRLLRSYQAAGVPQPTVKITREGDLIAIPAEPPKDDDTSESIIKQL
jgi:hypothetical protein